MTTESADVLGNPSLIYSCSTVGPNFVTVCADGGLETTTVCGAFSVPPPAGINAFALMQSLPGYESYTCNMQLVVDDSCGCDYDSGYVSCQNFSPPPSPPPPSPPPPPPPVDYPHKCFPGNSASQGGVDDGYQLELTPYALTVTDRTTDELTFRVDGKPCDASNGIADCCDMDLYKIQIVLANSRCRVRKILINGQDKSSSYETNYYIPPHPDEGTPYFSLKITTLTSEPIAHVGSYITLMAGGDCPTMDTLLPDGKFWYAYFNGANLNFNCCGTKQDSAFPA